MGTDRGVRGTALLRRYKLLPTVVQLTAQFIRTLRNGILMGMRWARAMELLLAAMKSYL
jgi:hypothetical protein